MRQPTTIGVAVGCSDSLRRRSIGFWICATLVFGLTGTCTEAFSLKTVPPMHHPPSLGFARKVASSSILIGHDTYVQIAPLSMLIEIKDHNTDDGAGKEEQDTLTDENRRWVDELLERWSFLWGFLSKLQRPRPPMFVEDTQLLMYDIFLILNLTASISYWVVHRMSFDYVLSAISEGSLMCILWFLSGLFNGAFLYSAVDGNFNSSDARAGPKAAGMLGLQTFIGTASLRVITALISAVLEHRRVGIVPGEDLIPLEIAFGLVLLSMWRLLHSSFTPRV